MDLADVSEYEAKRLRRIEENRKKLQALNLPTLATSSPLKSAHKKRKRDTEEKSLEPTRKSLRQWTLRKLGRQQRRHENQQWKQEEQQFKQEQQERDKSAKQERKRLEKLEKKKTKELKKQNKLKKKLQKELQASQEEDHVQHVKETLKYHVTSEPVQQLEQQPRILDWRLRRKLQAQAERRQASLKRREERKAQRGKEDVEKMELKRIAREMKKEQRAKELMESRFLEEVEKQQRFEELELMREEDRLSRRWAKQLNREAKLMEREEKLAAKVTLEEDMWSKRMEMRREASEWYEMENRRVNREAERKEEEALSRELYPVRQVNLPFVRISNAKEKDKMKLSSLLKVDANLFHGFSLGKQFLPPGKNSVMRALCPGGYNPEFRSDGDIHAWQNAITIFMNATSGLFYRYMFQEEKIRGRKHVIFRWARCQDVTPPILERLRRVQKGEEQLRFDNNYYDTPNPTDPKPGPLLLFVQYPKGPYIYCGRLGYLGYRSNPLEFSFQLLDINALNWGQLRRPIISMKGGDDTEALSEYEAKRLQRMEENQRMLASLDLPTMSRRSPRPQAAKPAVKLEATRRSSRQQKRRVIAEQQARERQLEEQRQLERQVAVKKAREAQIALKRQQIELERQQQKLRREQQKEEEKSKTQKIKYQKEEERRHVRIRQLKQIETERFREWRQQMKEQESQRRRELERQNEPPPEIVAQRNAEVQKFIQEELDKQARLAKEKKEREMQLQALVTQREAERVKQEEQYRQLATTEVQAGNKPVITADQVVAVGALELPIEFELVL
ncbi:hypothetical protein JG688_00015793 [Phytophthora aleatoria]|uniref:Uncharacterized protein n=1 Tax=Phytophthora aleatoria TaxID=2496075 RepID=A0A8J5IZ13_9STRA|nr:hypothetical protein JG688_00015793 [Phytophthora aleatoria]